MGYLDVLRQNQFLPHPAERAERAERDEPPPDGGPDGNDTDTHPPASPPAGAASPEDRCAAPGCRAPIDRFGADGVGRCVRHAHAPPDGADPRGGSPCEESEESEERGAPAVLSAAIVQGRACEESEESEESPPGEGGACPRCARLDEAARQVLAQLRAHAALPPALRALSPERLGILVKWAIVGLTNPRPQWPPPRPTDAQRTHRPALDDIIVGLGGRGDDLPFEGTENESEAEDWLFLDDDDDADVH